VKHYLNTELRGKTDKSGISYFPVYITFSVNSQTYKYKSQLVRRLLSLEEYSRLEDLYQGGGPSTLLQKERDIVEDLFKQCIVDGKFIQKEFKKAYIYMCQSILDLLEEVEISLPITKWDKVTLSSELYAQPLVEHLNQSLNHSKGVDRGTHNLLRASALKYHAIRSNSDDTNGLMLLYDWIKKDSLLKKDFLSFLSAETNKSIRNDMLNYLHILNLN
jgi:hypothetical protein